jgi:hypothetical protein
LLLLDVFVVFLVFAHDFLVFFDQVVAFVDFGLFFALQGLSALDQLFAFLLAGVQLCDVLAVMQYLVVR